MQPISVDADFFMIGGNSLLAGKVVSRLRRAFAVDLPFTVIFQERTVTAMAAYLEAHGDTAQRSEHGRQQALEALSIPRCPSYYCTIRFPVEMALKVSLREELLQGMVGSRNKSFMAQRGSAGTTARRSG